ncbi:MAG TPA: TldD/PmbA family protein, partial [Thermoprotei archaeon]|nr:TldD/PmbA family protein [Thermoprotei archaeon]
MFNVLDKVLKIGLKMGVDQIEVYGSLSRRKYVELEKSEVKIASISSRSGIGVRIFKNKSIGFSFTEDFSEKSLENVVKKAVAIASIRKKEEFLNGFMKPAKPPSVKDTYFKDTEEFSLEEITDNTLYMRDIALNRDKRVKAISGGISVVFAEKFLKNSLGVELYSKGTWASASLFVVAEDSGITASGFDFQSERNHKLLRYDEIALSAVDHAVKQLKPRKIEGGDMDVVIDPIALSSILGATFNRAICADNVQEKRSFLVGFKDKKIASDILTVIDDPLMPGGIATRSFDDEGVPSKTLRVVENGVLKSYLYDIYRAQREGVESTGHAVRGYSSEPYISPSNIVFKVKDLDSLDNIISDISNGVYVRWVIGAHTANMITGEFSVALGEAYHIRNGEISYSLKEAMLGGNIREMLNKV